VARLVPSTSSKNRLGSPEAREPSHYELSGIASLELFQAITVTITTHKVETRIFLFRYTVIKIYITQNNLYIFNNSINNSINNKSSIILNN
jgi:hypothetical protein